jgi:hypothetical protein
MVSTRYNQGQRTKLQDELKHFCRIFMLCKNTLSVSFCPSTMIRNVSS